jgi:tRNA-binding protein
VEYQPVEGFFRYELKVGTIVEAAINERAKKPAYRLVIDFGPDGLKKSSAQITDHYRPSDLIGRQVVAVLNFPPRQVASVNSEVLVLGATDEDGAVVLLGPDTTVANGTAVS